nr:hypothetical protein [Tanacetum cinerariifolium]
MIAVKTSGSGNTFLLAVAFFFRQWEVPSSSGNFLTSSGNALCILFPTLKMQRNDILTLQSVKDWLGKCFAMKYLGDAAYILGIKIYRYRSKRLIRLSQDTYLHKILKRFKMENSKKGNLPLHHGIKISKDLCLKTNEELDRMSRVLYALVVGTIMYAMTYTRPDVSFALRMVSQHQPNLDKEIDKDDSHSQYGWVLLLNGGAVTWKISKQDTVADSTCESNYIVACEDLKEAIWMKNFIRDLGVVPIVQDPIEIYYDNESTVALTKEPKDHEKSKHIKRKYYFIRSKVEEGHMIVNHKRAYDNPADPFTKALAKSRHDKHARRVLYDTNVPLKPKGKFYKVETRPSMLYGSECWPITIALANRMEVAELRMLRRRPQSASVRRVEALIVDDLGRKGRPKPRWKDRMKLDMKELLLFKDMASDRNE